MTSESQSTVQALAGIAAILNAVAWPVLIAFLLIIYRSKIWSLLEVITKKIETATTFKAWQFQIETAEQEIKKVVKETGEAAGDGIQQGEIPKSQLDAAKEINKRLEQSPLSDQGALAVVEHQVQSLVREYELIRTEMPTGTQRTRRMNEVAGKMRALSLAARPLLRSLISGESAGERLAAICFLQVVPEFGYFSWLIERLMQEKQAFLLFHAAIAVSKLVQSHQYNDGAKVKDSIQRALQHVSSFKGGSPDQNTIDVLSEALERLR